MADLVTMPVLIEKVRHLGGFETLDEANAFITDANIRERLNANLRKVYLALVRARGHEYYRDFVDIVLEQDNSSYDINADHIAVISVDWQRVGATTWEPVLDFNEAERNGFDDDWFLSHRRDSSLRFQLRGTTIELLPVPKTAGDTLRVHFVPSFSSLDDEGEFDGICGFEEWAVWETLAEFQQKDSADWTLSMQKAAWWATEVETMAQQRVASLPLRVQRVRHRRRRGGCW